MKIIVLGDIHGRGVWKDILKKEEYSEPNGDKVVFLGDYVSTHDSSISSEEQISNLDLILRLKENNPCGIILLRGNHDMQHLGYYWAQCSGYFPKVAKYMTEQRERFLKNTQWIHIENNFLFSHAGVSNTWLRNSAKELNKINSLPPSELFEFTPDHWSDMTGCSITQPCTWIRPHALITDMVPGYIQIVGHTPVKDIFDWPGDKLWLCDCLAKQQYIVIENNEIIVKRYVEEYL